MSKTTQAERAAMIRTHVEKALIDAPPLNDEQRTRVASLLAPRKTLADAPPPPPDAVRKILSILGSAAETTAIESDAGAELLRGLE